ncbi:3-oxoacyl-[acyl-carrier protein] reductase [Actimicrobium sp. GrIS 1.19]|uniref:glucose 1-dehydrogenase n=1 Tax=Actimicrobium sp. GrIS 1.19 TaxID=3071708 RepID=UPI002E00A563|nr:3-oxoacyl-[acyl-carrier protein] reductase [Actimicrobium sp. GrIS 1.19]
MKKFDQKVAVITGSSHGIGAAIARRLARDGAAVVINYASNAAAAESIVAEITSAGGRAIAVQADVTKAADIARLFEETERAFGRLDILVNNAGIGVLKPLDEVDEADWDRVFALNAKAPLFVAKEAAKRLGPDGRIVNVSSSTTYFPLANTAIYAASKIVPRMYTEVLAKELGARGITVNSVAPGPTSPGMFENAPAALQAEAAAQSPFNRIGHPDDIAGVVAFLVSDDARWMTGQHLLVNGGATI